MTRFSNTRLTQLLRVVFVLVALPLLIPGPARGQRKPAAAGEEEGPLFHEYRGVQIGMTVEEARKKLGSPRDKSDTLDMFEFGENELAQVAYDAATHKVVTVSVDYMKGAKNVPAPNVVIGSDIETKPDGSMHKMVRYVKAGVWVSYSRTAGDSPLISITLQKIE